MSVYINDILTQTAESANCCRGNFLNDDFITLFDLSFSVHFEQCFKIVLRCLPLCCFNLSWRSETENDDCKILEACFFSLTYQMVYVANVSSASLTLRFQSFVVAVVFFTTQIIVCLITFVVSVIFALKKTFNLCSLMHHKT